MNIVVKKIQKKNQPLKIKLCILRKYFKIEQIFLHRKLKGNIALSYL